MPFFEAFLPETFIRGEGKDIETAERKAFAQWQREHTCNHHWGRQRPNGVLYTNGAGWCRRCGAFRGKMFREIVELGRLRKPISLWEKNALEAEADEAFDTYYKDRFPQEAAQHTEWLRIVSIRYRLYGVVNDTKTST